MTSTWTNGVGRTTALVGVLLAGVLLASRAQAQSPTGASGEYLFRTYCAVCHGQGAKGDGPLAASMRVKPANLTEISKRANGPFPKDMVFRTIDGREPVKGHGGPDMPVWGDVFMRATEGGDPAVVRARIEALVAYLETIQVKSAP
jgi:mono/diheme cytochrome c family protein